MFSGPRRTAYFSTLTSGLSAVIVCSAESTFGHADPLARVDHLTLEVRQVDLVVVDDAESSDAGCGEIQGRRRTKAARAEQEDLRVEQLLLAFGPDLGEQQMARVALPLLGSQRLRRLDLVATVLPQREAAGHRLDVLVAEVLDQRPRRPRRAVARGAVEDDVLGVIGDRAVDPRLEIALRDVVRTGDVAGAPLLRLAHVDDHRAVVQLLPHLARIDFIDPALDLAKNLSSGRGHQKAPKGSQDSILQRV